MNANIRTSIKAGVISLRRKVTINPRKTAANKNFHGNSLWVFSHSQVLRAFYKKHDKDQSPR